MLLVIWLLSQVFIVASFRIPSDSMEPELITGDYILVDKLKYGARLFNLTAAFRGEQANIYRMPGFDKVKRGDVLVFNFPHPKQWDRVEMDIMKYYIKRCVALPGDTFLITDGVNRVKGCNIPLGNIQGQRRIAQRTPESFDSSVYTTFPDDSVTGWNIQNFGPLFIPKAGSEITANRRNYVLYKKMIEWEQKQRVTYNDTMFCIGNRTVGRYRFLKNYFFVAGDRCEDSQDSRYWGLLPEEYIVGKAWLVWKSINPYTDEFRWDRFLKVIR